MSNSSAEDIYTLLISQLASIKQLSSGLQCALPGGAGAQGIVIVYWELNST